MSLRGAVLVVENAAQDGGEEGAEGWRGDELLPPVTTSFKLVEYRRTAAAQSHEVLEGNKRKEESIDAMRDEIAQECLAIAPHRVARNEQRPADGPGSKELLKMDIEADRRKVEGAAFARSARPIDLPMQQVLGARCGMATPSGFPVGPEVKMTYAWLSDGMGSCWIVSPLGLPSSTIVYEHHSGAALLYEVGQRLPGHDRFGLRIFQHQSQSFSRILWIGRDTPLPP